MAPIFRFARRESPPNYAHKPTRPRSLAGVRRPSRASRQPQFAPAASAFVAAAGVPREVGAEWGPRGLAWALGARKLIALSTGRTPIKHEPHHRNRGTTLLLWRHASPEEAR